MYLKLNRPTIEIETQEERKSRDVFFFNFVCGAEGIENRCKNRGSEAHTHWACHMRAGEIWVVGEGNLVIGFGPPTPL